MRFEQTFTVARPPEVVFDYLTDPTNLAKWQTSKTSVEQITDGPVGLGTRVRERTKPPGGKEFEQVVEFTEFERPARLHAHIVEGPIRSTEPGRSSPRTTERVCTSWPKVNCAERCDFFSLSRRS